jgi:hypothetical protein
MTNARESAARLAALLRREHAAMADFIVALSEFQRMRLWQQLGYDGLFMFLHRELGLSKGAAFYRKTAAELIERFPEIVEPLREGKLCITSPATAPASEPRYTARPLTAELSRLSVTVSRRFLQKLEAARAALSHARPGASTEEILEAGLDLVLARDAKKKGVVAKPRSEPPASSDPEYVPAHVKRAIWKRSGGCCEWPVDGGGVCGSILRLEIDHIQPRSLGGPSTIENCRVLCRFHQDVAARLAFGDEWMDQFTRVARRQREQVHPPSRIRGSERESQVDQHESSDLVEQREVAERLAIE